MQEGIVSTGANVVIIDDLIATGAYFKSFISESDSYILGGSAMAAGELVRKQGGITLEYLFIVGLPFLKGTSKLDAPAYIMLEIDE